MEYSKLAKHDWYIYVVTNWTTIIDIIQQSFFLIINTIHDCLSVPFCY